MSALSGSRRMVIVTATKNEVRNIPLVMAELGGAQEALRPMGVEVEILVVDDASSDGTRDTLKVEAELRGLSVRIIEGPNEGLSGAVVSGLRAALDESPDLVCLLDADGQHDPLQIPKLVQTWLDDPELHAVFGSRFLGGAEFVGVTRTRKALSHGARLALRGATRMRIPSDPTTSFRVSTPAAIRAFLDDVPVQRLDGYQFFFWFAVFTAARFRFADVPIRFRPRLMGASHLSLRDVGRAARSLPEVASRSREWRRRGVYHAGFPDYPTEYLDGIAAIEKYTRWIADSVAPYVRGTVLEVGAGTGTMTELFRDLPGVASVTAVEPDDDRHARLFETTSSGRGRATAQAVHGTIGDVDEQFDTVLYCNSLEHIEDLLGELRGARHLVRRGGSLVIFGPGHESLYGELDRMSGHWRRFSLSTLSADVEASGYRVIERRYLDPLGALSYLAGSKLGRSPNLTPTTLKIYEKLILPPSRALGPLTKRRFGKNVLVVAQPVV
jgi:glycosyltransferase involved in cell wall biosynthesis/precorrin-6B methylase 2